MSICEWQKRFQSSLRQRLTTPVLDQTHWCHVSLTLQKTLISIKSSFYVYHSFGKNDLTCQQ